MKYIDHPQFGSFVQEIFNEASSLQFQKSDFHFICNAKSPHVSRDINSDVSHRVTI